MTSPLPLQHANMVCYVGDFSSLPDHLVPDSIPQRNPEHTSFHTSLSDLKLVDQPCRECPRSMHFLSCSNEIYFIKTNLWEILQKWQVVFPHCRLPHAIYHKYKRCYFLIAVYDSHRKAEVLQSSTTSRRKKFFSRGLHLRYRLKTRITNIKKICPLVECASCCDSG
jgi:hypothetical protein